MLEDKHTKSFEKECNFTYCVHPSGMSTETLNSTKLEGAMINVTPCS